MSNPLIQAYRKPKAYISLPSRGRFYKDKPQLSVDGELAIYPMTARDELITKNPDALFNGEATVALIKSCCPDIADPRQVPVCDIPMIMLGIRQATYGTDINVDVTCPACQTLNQLQIPTSHIASTAKAIPENDIAVIGADFKVKLHPYDLSGRTNLQIQQIQQQKAIQTLLNSDLTDEDREQKFGRLFVEMAELTVRLVKGCIVYVETPEGERVTDEIIIGEWLENISSTDYEEIKRVIDTLSETGMKSDFKAICQECGNQWITPVELDMANFFEG